MNKIPLNFNSEEQKKNEYSDSIAALCQKIKLAAIERNSQNNILQSDKTNITDINTEIQNERTVIPFANDGQNYEHGSELQQIKLSEEIIAAKDLSNYLKVVNTTPSKEEQAAHPNTFYFVADQIFDE